MSGGVSQIEYWREVNKSNENTNNNNHTNVKEGGPGSIYLSYDMFVGLSVIGGLLALDHLYLRSPLTFIAKIVVNILTLGSWWLYDVSQAIFNKDVVKVFGLGVPGMGPKGIAAGVLANDVPDKKHMAFFIYGLALLLGGIFGLDSFIVGDKQTGIIRIICLLTGILAPIAIIWWLINIGKFLFKTKNVTNQYWEYFGAPQPAEHRMTFVEKLVRKFPFLEYIVGPVTKVKNIVSGAVKDVVNDTEELGEALLLHPINTLETVAIAPIKFVRNKLDEAVSITEKIVSGPIKAVGNEISELSDEAANIFIAPIKMVGNKVNNIDNKVNNIGNKLGGILTAPIKMVGDNVNNILTNTVEKIKTELKPAIELAIQPVELALQTVIDPLIQPIKQTLDTGLGVIDDGLTATKMGLSLGKNVLNTGATLAANSLEVVGQTANAATKALSLAPAALALSSGFTDVAAKQALNTLGQQGGSIVSKDSGILPYILIGTLVMISVSGLVITYRRYKQNEQSRNNDSPPEPGVLRKSYKEKST